MPHPNTQIALYADDTAILAQSWRTDTIIHRHTHATSVLLRCFTRWKLQVNVHKTEVILFTRRRPVPTAPLHFQHTVIPWNSQVRYLGILLDPKLLFTRHLTSVTHKATGIFLQLFLLARDSTLSIPNKITLYKLFIRSILIRCPCLEQHVILQLSSTANFTVQMPPRYCQLPQAHPHRTASCHLKLTPIRDFMYHLTANFFDSCPAHPNPLDRSIGNYSLADLHRQYKKYIHKRPKHLL